MNRTSLLKPDATYIWCGTTPSKWVVVDDLLTFSRLVAQRSKQPVHPDDLMRQALTELRHENRHVEISSSELPVCEADPALLKQVWINLLTPSNFRNRRPPKSRSAVNKQMASPYILSDNGVGFDMQYAQTLRRIPASAPC